MQGNFLDVWHGNLSIDENTVNENVADEVFRQTYWDLLNEYEQEKSASFTRLNIKNKYIKTRAELRKVLSTYLNIEPRQIIIETGEYGKPFLLKEPLFFNLSHTRNRLVIAVSNIGDIGVDIEQVIARKSLAALVKKCFSEEESVYWHTLSEQQKTLMFYRFWVRKEAFVKAVGRGLALGLDRCVINPVEQAHFLEIPVDYGLPLNWKIVDVPIDEEHVCTVVTKDTEFEYTQTELK